MFHMVTSVLSICRCIPRVMLSYMTGLSVRSLFIQRLLRVLQVKLWLNHKLLGFFQSGVSFVHLMGVVVCLRLTLNDKILISGAARWTELRAELSNSNQVCFLTSWTYVFPIFGVIFSFVSSLQPSIQAYSSILLLTRLPSIVYFCCFLLVIHLWQPTSLTHFRFVHLLYFFLRTQT